jgi:polyisoprenoid-binding protein YceI
MTKSMKHPLPTLLFAAAASFAAPVTYQIDGAHSSAQFSVKHLAVSNTRGEFTKMSGTITYDPQNLAASKVEAVIDVSTINTREPKRDEHLKSADFFDVAKYPTMTFKSTRWYKEGGKLKIQGDLTLHGVTKAVTLDVDGPTPEVKDPWGNYRVGASASTRINRKDWGLTWNKAMETGGLLVGEEVTITLDIEAMRPAEAPAPAKTPVKTSSR